jgi:hypothetical protein
VKRRCNSRSYIVRGSPPPRYWEPTVGDVVYIEGTRAVIKTISFEDETPYVWFQRPVRGTVGMSVRNLKAIARIETGRQSNPIDMTMLAYLIGTKPVVAEIQKVGKQIRLQINKPSKAMLYKLGLRKSKNPKTRNFTAFEGHFAGHYSSKARAEKEAQNLNRRPDWAGLVLPSFRERSFHSKRVGDEWIVVGDSKNPGPDTRRRKK